MKKKIKILYSKLSVVILFVFILTIFFPTKMNMAYGEDNEKLEIQNELQGIYDRRSKAFVTGDFENLKEDFDTSNKYGRWALEHEIARVKYLSEWSAKRNMEFSDVKSSISIGKIYPVKHGMRIRLKENYKFSYLYNGDEEAAENSFGVGIRHSVDLVKKGGKWIIYSDWYTDCFEDALKQYSGDFSPIDLTNIKPYNLSKCPKVITDDYKGRYNRKKAVEYADRYCGASLQEGSDFKYNKKYKDYTGIGGDCTNFASQVLGDKEAGGLRLDGGWYYNYNKYGNSEGSTAWVNADAFKNYVIYSGKGHLIKRGTFEEIIKPTQDCPCGILQKLELGDLICYAKGSNVDHFAIVTGWDSHGYPLINSHTTDRYHVPWDLGWGNKGIKFLLIHVR